MWNTRRELGKEERSNVVLATVSSHSGEVTVMATASELTKGPHLKLDWLRENVDEVRGGASEVM